MWLYLSIGALEGICVSAKTVSLFHNHDETLPCIISRNLQYSNMKEYKNLASFVFVFFLQGNSEENRGEVAVF